MWCYAKGSETDTCVVFDLKVNIVPQKSEPTDPHKKVCGVQARRPTSELHECVYGQLER